MTAAAVGGALVWFDFAELCGRATSTTDYLGLASRFSTWVLSGGPTPSTCDEQARRRFADLVDVLCDRDVTLRVATSRTIPETLCDLRDISRTTSRPTLLRTPRSAP